MRLCGVGSESELMSQAALAGPEMVPPLRLDLEIQPGPASLWGQPTWTLHDPAANRFFRVGTREVEILRSWRPGPVATVAEQAHTQATPVTETHVLELREFLSRNNLLRDTPDRAIPRFLRVQTAKRGLRHLLRTYLFFRIHLFQPDAFLSSLAQRTGVLFTPGFALIALGFTFLSLFLLLRQWDMFLATVPEFLNSRGALLSLVSLFGAKIFHELAHGLAAKRFGLRVTSMGVAVLLLWPVLYTNVNQSWKLNDSRQRLIIDGAGIAAELLLAAVAGFAWLLLDPGPLRDICFVLAVTSWIMSLAVNLNPLMRFDGYYLLSDLLGVDNLMERGQALLHWHVSEWLTGAGDAPPERLPGPTQSVVLVHAVCTRIYRLTLALSIAALVYALAFKALGVFLAVHQLWSSLGAPLLREIRRIWKRRQELGFRPMIRGSVFLAVVLLVLCWPWNTTIATRAMLTAAQTAHLHAPFDGVLTRVPAQDPVPTRMVHKGDALFRVHSPELEQHIRVAEIRESSTRHMSELLSMDQTMLRQRLTREAESREQRANLDGLLQRREKADVRAPLSGRLELPAQAWRTGIFVAEGTYLGTVLDTTRQRIVAYVDELELSRISPGGSARLYPYRPEARPVDCVIRSIDATAATVLETAAFASVHGGDVPARQGPKGRLILQGSAYRVVLEPISPCPTERQYFGRLEIQGRRSALIQRIIQKVRGLLTREFGI